MERSELSILAIQGPESLGRIQQILREHDKAAEADHVAELKPFIGGWCGDWFLARTGYTGEKGVEIILPAADAYALWEQLIQARCRTHRSRCARYTAVRGGNESLW